MLTDAPAAHSQHQVQKSAAVRLEKDGMLKLQTPPSLADGNKIITPPGSKQFQPVGSGVVWMV